MYQESYMQNNYYNSNWITCIIENGNIYQIDMYNSKKQIGIDNTTAEEIMKETERLHKLGVDNGYIEIPKTQEEINQELINTNLQLMENMKSMQEELKKMKGDNANVQLSRNSPKNGNRPTGSKESTGNGE